MTTPEHAFPGLAAFSPAEGDGFHTALISRLVNELCREGDGTTPSALPAKAIAPHAPAFPGVWQQASAAPGYPAPRLPGITSGGAEGIRAARGFAPAGSTPDGGRAPPVHPVIEPVIEPLAEGPAVPPPASASADAGWRRISVVDTPAGIGRDDPFASPDFYFLTPGTSRFVPGQGKPPHQTPPAVTHGGLTGFDPYRVRADFPALHQTVNGHPLVWLDNAATTQKPQSVIDATSHFYAHDNSNIHRAAHTLAARSTDLFEGAREKIARFIGAAEPREIVFLRGTTEAINLVANTFGRTRIGAGDEIIVTAIEHHANIVPWQLLSQATGAVLKVVPVNDRGEVILEQFAALLTGRTKLVSVTHVANALGTVVPVEEIIAIAHAHGVPVLVDAAQSAPHVPIDVKALDADFLVLSGHKIFGPTGIGILYGKADLLESLPPWQGGGHMIKDVTFAKTVYQGLPERFEAGTPDIAGAVGLGAAVDYLQQVGLPAIAAYEHALLDYATAGLEEIAGLRLIGTARHKASVLSFVVKDIDPQEVAKFLDRRGIAVRSGHHCAQPALRRFGVEATVRASLAFYNTREDVDALVTALHVLPKS
ncbi:UNVERIFIED_ORG: cysteine desulfurase/selenocysteine lyase [Xanthobacter viscosus]|jgi:cysteine desulfurase/selenocysteine lyase|uniref:cysteine desulfurase n=1 Tax=Xanthobacter autotrophicus TaxID=280 RepID=A0A6C1KFL0_XANAU|nr:cysteine desulfurase [Xanthobacter autotrophicus]TLX43058.1 SufS family cysteine desulfurase [Xanthobacter autotrophicus]